MNTYVKIIILLTIFYLIDILMVSESVKSLLKTDFEQNKLVSLKKMGI